MQGRLQLRAEQTLRNTAISFCTRSCASQILAHEKALRNVPMDRSAPAAPGILSLRKKETPIAAEAGVLTEPLGNVVTRARAAAAIVDRT